MVPGFEAEKSIIGNKAFCISNFTHNSFEDNVIPLARTCRPCTSCVGGTQTCWRYIRADDACEQYDKSCTVNGTNCCGKRNGSPCP